MSRFIEVHILQQLPPSCLNRDETGTPKICMYGGVPRARVSSQAWKKAVRDMLRGQNPTAGVTHRTRDWRREIGARSGLDMTVERNITLFDRLREIAGLDLNGSADLKAKGMLSALLALGDRQWDALGAIARDAAASDDPDEYLNERKPDIRRIIRDDRALDLALFGRMVAVKDTKTDYGVDAACQVAHAIGVGRTDVEYDYYSAVDENPDADGAGMIGDIGFDAPLLYRYALIEWDRLLNNLHDAMDATDATIMFLNAFALSLPSGRQNTFAARTQPLFVAVTVRDDRPANLSAAYATPVPLDDGTEAVRRLDTEAQRVETMFDMTPVFAAHVGGDAPHLGEPMESWPRLLDTLHDALEAL